MHYTLPPNPQAYTQAAYLVARQSQHRHQGKILLALFVLLLTAAALFIRSATQQLHSVLQDWGIPADSELHAQIAHHINAVMLTLDALWCSILLLIICSQHFTIRRTMRQKYLLHESQFTADAAGCRQIYPQENEVWYSWTTLTHIGEQQGNVVLAFGSQFIVLPRSIFADDDERHSVAAQITAWQHAAQQPKAA